MNSVALVGLVKIVLPSSTLRFSDGGFFVYASETYRSKDAVFGTIGQLETMEESVGDIVPAITLTLLPPDSTAPADISQPGNQTSRVTFFIAEFDPDTGVISTAESFFDGQIDQTVLTVGRSVKRLTMTVVSLAERLFEGNIGNSMNPTWHKSVWAGELGHDNATGLSKPVAWGVESPTKFTYGGGGVGGGAFGGGGGSGSGGSKSFDFTPSRTRYDK